MQRRDLVVERFAAFVEAAQRAGDGGLDEWEIDLTAPRPTRRARDLLDQVDEPPPVAVGIRDDRVARLGRERPVGHRHGQRSIEELTELFGLERFQYVDRRAREQRADDLERRVLGGGADERQQAPLHERQESILLRLVEAMHFVDEEDRVPPRLRQRRLRVRNRLANILDPGEHGRDGEKIRVERVGHQPRERGLAGARRAPEDHRMRLARGEGDRERLVWPKQVPLADDVRQRFRPQSLRERRGGVLDREQISRRRHRRRRAA